jgi:hypothetical protein
LAEVEAEFDSKGFELAAACTAEILAEAEEFAAGEKQPELR